VSTAKMIDSVGLNFVVTILKAVQANKGKLEVVYANPNVHRTLLFTRLDKHATLVDGGTKA
jgi:anti-anti-sigma factor